MADPGETATARAGRQDTDGAFAAWPRALRVQPRTLLLVVGAWLAVAWAVVLLVDIINVGGIGDHLYRPMWRHLFNSRPVEWTQWFILAFFVVAAGYVAGRLSAVGERGSAAFFGLIGLGAGFMLIEDAGDIRHSISGYVQRHIGDEVLGLPYRTASDVPYFALLALIPVYAVLRYGRHPWHVRQVRPYLVAGVGLYAVAAIASGFRHLGDMYTRIGSALDANLLGGRFPATPGHSQERTHFLLVDSFLEETVELLAVTCLLAVLLAYVNAVAVAQREAAPVAGPSVQQRGDPQQEADEAPTTQA
jgi:hypothetical protein